MGVFLALLLVFTLSESSSPAHSVFSVTDYGAVGDGKNYETQQIQAAIDACHEAGGGTVKFPRSRYLVGTLFLKSGVLLNLGNARIHGGTRMEDYPADPRRWYVILAENATNVGITGGTINGQGRKFIEKFDKKASVMKSWNTTGVCHGDKCRPRLAGFFDCKNVNISAIELRIPAISNLHIVRCDNTFLDGVRLMSHFYIPHNHGIHVVDSNNTLMNDIFIDNGGNAITVKTVNGPVYNLTVTKSDLRTKLSAIKFGSGLGTPLYADQKTQNKQQLAYAMLCIEIDAKKPLPESLHILLKGMEYHLKLEYDWRPLRCEDCCTFGHIALNCKLKMKAKKQN